MSIQLSALPVTNATMLCVGAITSIEAQALRDEGYDSDGRGYYLFLADEQKPNEPIRVLAQFFSAEEAEACAWALKWKGAEIDG